MKKLVYSILLIIFVFFAIDRIGGQLMWYVNQHSNDVTAPKIKYLTDGINEEIILMGTSRCQGHYVPSIIRDSVGMSVYNGGVDASENIFSHYILLCHILEQHTPKVICLDVRRKDLFTEANPYKAITFFAPYYGKNSMADSVYKTAGSAWSYEVSHLYRFNSKAPSNILGLIYNKQDRKGADNGYLPIPKPDKVFDIDEKITQANDTLIDNNKLEYLLRFINLCKSKNVQLVFAISPNPTYVDKSYYEDLKKIADESSIPFMDYHTKGLFLDHPDYFKDNQHMWDKGAKEFSSLFASDLKKIIYK